MSIKHFLAAALLSTTAYASQPDFVVPAVASTEGAGGSRWTSELTLHNAGTTPLDVVLTYRTSSLMSEKSVTVGPRTTISYGDVVKENFGLGSTLGALEIDVVSGEVRKLAVSSRTVNTTAGGELGQDVPALRLSDAMSGGDTAVIAGPRRALGYRFNAGLYTVDALKVTWSLLRANGSVAAAKSETYAAGTHLQLNGIVQNFFGVTAEAADVVHAKLESGRAFFYGSIVAEATGDPTFVHAARTRENLLVTVNGIDLDENGTIDVADADGDYRIDQPITVITARFPNYFQLVATDPEGDALTYELVNAPSDVKLLDDGIIQWVAGSEMAGKTTTLTVRISDGTDSVDVIIPITFQ